MDYKASRCGVADASLHHAKWGHDLGGSTWRGAKMGLYIFFCAYYFKGVAMAASARGWQVETLGCFPQRRTFASL